MSNQMLLKCFAAEAAIPAYRLVKMGTADGKVTLATAATDKTIGVCSEVGAAIGERVDVVLSGIADVEAGAAIVRGSLVTADGTGRGVTAAPGAGVNNRVVGVAAEAASAAGDIIPVILNPCIVQG